MPRLVHKVSRLEIQRGCRTAGLGLRKVDDRGLRRGGSRHGVGEVGRSRIQRVVYVLPRAVVPVSDLILQSQLTSATTWWKDRGQANERRVC